MNCNLLKMAMTVKVAIVCVLKRIFDLIFCKYLCAQVVNQRINRILNK